MAEIAGYHHLSLTVTDLDRSTAWWTDVLGFTTLRRFDRDGMTKVILRHPSCGILLSFTGHGERALAGPFSEFRTGMDHLAFAVTDRAALDAWKARFEELGVEHSDVKTSPSGELIAFRDPDNIALEVYTDAPQ